MLVTPNPPLPSSHSCAWHGRPCVKRKFIQTLDFCTERKQTCVILLGDTSAPLSLYFTGWMQEEEDEARSIGVSYILKGALLFSN